MRSTASHPWASVAGGHDRVYAHPAWEDLRLGARYGSPRETVYPTRNDDARSRNFADDAEPNVPQRHPIVQRSWLVLPRPQTRVDNMPPDQIVSASSLLVAFHRVVRCFFPPNYPRDFRSELSQPVHSDSDCHLGNCSLISLDEHVRISWIPCGRDSRSPKCSSIREQLGTQGLLGSIVSHKIPKNRVARAWPQAVAATTIVSGLPARHCISRSA